MKEFRKNQEGHFVCEECDRVYKKKDGLSKHINLKHGIFKYYDKWLKEEGDGICKICAEKTIFISLAKGYKNCCSKECSNKYAWKMCKEVNLKKYGVEHQLARKEIREKSRVTMKEKYGGETSAQSIILLTKMQNTMVKKYGVKFSAQNKDILQKQLKTKRKKYKNGCYNEEKFINTNIRKYGVKYPQQSKEIFSKTKQSLFKILNYGNTNLTYQGSYELDFLEKFYDKIDIENGPSIDYFFEGEQHVYHSDFYIPSMNLVVEIKNSYLLSIDKNKIRAKESSAISNGYNYCIIVNKDYKEFIQKFC